MDDLFARAEPKPLTVSQVNSRARLLLERTFGVVTVVGEVSGYKLVAGHHYFCLKDRDAQLSAVLFRREAAGNHVDLRDGIEVLATGRLTIYSARGSYQLVVDRVERRGAGALQAAYEELKRRLEAEGLFAAARKRKLPLVPRGVAVVTSPTGAVIRDIVHVATRRWPGARLLVVPTRVQGADAAPFVAAAVRRVGALADRLGLDVVVVARGGGSLEDLWCFNDERVARAIFDSPLPVVSAVGHETDFTIADFVADVRAPTPSAAAELVFPVQRELAALLTRTLARAHAALDRELDRRRLHLRALKAELGDARRLVRDDRQRIAELRQRQLECARHLVKDQRLRLRALESRLERLHPRTHLAGVRAALGAARHRVAVASRQGVSSRRERLAGLDARLALAGRQGLAARRERLTALAARLAALSPVGILERGYAIVQTADGRAVRSHAEVAAGDAIRVRLHEGRLEATVDSTEPPSAVDKAGPPV